MSSDASRDSGEQLESALHSDNGDRVADVLAKLSPGEAARVVSRLAQEDQSQLLTLLAPAKGADLIVELPEEQACLLLTEVPQEQAAAILDLVPSDEQTDILSRMPSEQAQSILAKMAQTEADDVRRLSRYAANSAGGLMITEYLAYPENARVTDVIADLRHHADQYARYDLQYVYVVDGNKKLVGVLRLRDLLLAPEDGMLSEIMYRDLHRVGPDAPLDELLSFFARHPYFGAPVTEPDGGLVGVLLRADVEEAVGEETDRRFLLFSGILGGEEFRTMPLRSRIGRRLAWLGISAVLNLLAASIVWIYQDTLESAIALAVFLPVISGLGGSCGNQALAVSVRELSLGLVKPYEFWWVIVREASVGILNGLALGTTVGLLAASWQGDAYLGLVVGVAVVLTTLISVCLGGAVPLLLKLVGVDPAMASGPILMTITDMFGFFVALNLAGLFLVSS